MSEPPAARSTSAALFAEAFGTFVLVTGIVGTSLFATGAGDDAVAGVGGAIIAVALAAGFAVLAGMYAFGSWSGGHFNPAVTIGLAVAGRFPWRGTVAYLGAQVVGGALATTVIVLIGLFGPSDWLQNAQDGGFASNGWGALSPAGFDIGGAIIVEVLFTAVFVMVFLGVTHPERGAPAFAGLVIGLAFTLVHLVTIPIDGGGINPARSIATALYGGADALLQLWVFIVFPIAGAVFAGLAYRALLETPRRT
jgi:aquaporin Z